MKRHHLLAALLCLASVTAYSQEEPGTDGPLQPPTNPGPRTVLNVAAVLKLHEAQVDDGIIIAKLNQAATPMNLSTDDILHLKQAGVSDAVVRAMIAPTASGPQTVVYRNESFEKFHSMNPTGATLPYGTDDDVDPNANNPLAPHDSGIYLDSQTGGTDNLQFLERTAISGVKMNAGAVFSFFAYPLTMRYEIPGPHALVRTKDPQPTFYFYFEDKSAGLGKHAFSAADVSSPTQFQLQRFDTTKKERLLTAGKFGIFTGTSGGPKSIPFTTQRIHAGLYKITVTQPLQPGEYVLAAPPAAGTTNADGNPVNGGQPDLFDFGVDPA